MTANKIITTPLTSIPTGMYDSLHIQGIAVGEGRDMQAIGVKTAGRWALLVLVAVLAALYLGRTRAEAEAPAQPPAPRVQIIEVAPVALRDWRGFSGRLAAVERVDIKPLVGGRIEQVLFSDGEQVSQGQLLFVIDPRPHQARLEQARAALDTARARAQLAGDELARNERLLAQKLVAQSAYDAALTNARVAQATVAQAGAEVSQAALNLEYAHIRAPIGGRISRPELTQGNLVDAGAGAPVMATVVANDRLYAEFNVDEASYVQFVRAQQQSLPLPVEMFLPGSDSQVLAGTLAAFDNQLDSSSGTIRARALFDNAGGLLTPGLFVKLRLGAAEERQALLVPERAIGTNQSRRYVLVVNAESTLEYREVSLGDVVGNERLILDGLSAGEQVVVNGLSHVRPGMPVVAELLSAPAVAERSR